MADGYLTLLKTCRGIRTLTDCPAASLTSFHIGGPVSCVVYPGSIESLLRVVELLRRECVPYRLVGYGTNLLARDEGYPGVWVMTPDCRAVRFRETRVEAECGMPLRSLVESAARRGLGGLENLFGIPGSVGGAVVMNAGAYGTSVSDLITSVTVYDEWRACTRSFSFDDCAFGYRKSIFQRGRYIVLSAEFRLTSSREDLVRAGMRSVTEKRVLSQPLDLPSAGSIFRRPVGAFAGKLIADADLAGERIGDIQVSPKHCGFFVNLGQGKAHEVRALIARVQNRVFEESGVFLQPELVIE